MCDALEISSPSERSELSCVACDGDIDAFEAAFESAAVAERMRH